VIVFLDTEFTALVVEPHLLSVGLVEGHPRHREFYAEVTDADRLRAASWFAQGAVLPQFGKIAHAACTYAELGARLGAFLHDITETLPAGEWAEIAFGHHLDWALVERAVMDCGVQSWQSTRPRLRPVNVYDITGYGAGQVASEAYFKTQRMALFSRHHALCDARALGLAYAAATTPGLEPAQPLPDSRLAAHPALSGG
jgi:hypothetical protein